MNKFSQVVAIALVSLAPAPLMAKDVEFRCEGQGHSLYFNSSEERVEIKGQSSNRKWFDLAPSNFKVRQWRSGEVIASANVSGPSSWEIPERGVIPDGIVEVAFDKVMDRYVAKIFLKLTEGQYQLAPAFSLKCD